MTGSAIDHHKDLSTLQPFRSSKSMCNLICSSRICRTSFMQSALSPYIQRFMHSVGLSNVCTSKTAELALGLRCKQTVREFQFVQSLNNLGRRILLALARKVRNYVQKMMVRAWLVASGLADVGMMKAENNARITSSKTPHHRPPHHLDAVYMFCLRR